MRTLENDAGVVILVLGLHFLGVFKISLLYREMGVRQPVLPVFDTGTQGERNYTAADIRDGAWQFALLTIVDIAVFFAVLIVGFLYVWKRGDLDWVRAVTQHEPARASTGPHEPASHEPAISA